METIVNVEQTIQLATEIADKLVKNKLYLEIVRPVLPTNSIRDFLTPINERELDTLLICPTNDSFTGINNRLEPKFRSRLENLLQRFSLGECKSSTIFYSGLSGKPILRLYHNSSGIFDPHGFKISNLIVNDDYLIARGVSCKIHKISDVFNCEKLANTVSISFMYGDALPQHKYFNQNLFAYFRISDPIVGKMNLPKTALEKRKAYAYLWGVDERIVVENGQLVLRVGNNIVIIADVKK